MESKNATTLLAIRDADQLYLKACELQGYEPLTMDRFSFLPENQQAAAYSEHRIVTVIEAGMGGHEFDWNSHNEQKWFPIWDMVDYEGDAPGSGFRLDFVNFGRTLAGVGARHCSPTEQMARHIATVMREDYRRSIKK